MSEFVKHLTYQSHTHEPDSPALTLDGISVAYNDTINGRTIALENVDFSVQTGERIAIVGPNGAGKSTLFNLIVGTLKPNSGNVRVFGHGPDGHICIAYVPQRNKIDWSFPVTVEDVVMMGRVGRIGLFKWPRKQDWAMVRQSLARVQASHLAKRQIGGLSGGQQQRVFIARALAQEAELLLLDEPLTGLDKPSQDVFFNILDGLRPDGVTALVATHDLNLAAERFDKVMLLNRGIVAYGEPTAVLTPTNLQHAYGGQMHLISTEESTMALADTCCGGHD
jgi:manganese/iron transport system ATP-binding protein